MLKYSAEGEKSLFTLTVPANPNIFAPTRWAQTEVSFHSTTNFWERRKTPEIAQEFAFSRTVDMLRLLIGIGANHFQQRRVHPIFARRRCCNQRISSSHRRNAAQLFLFIWYTQRPGNCLDDGVRAVRCERENTYSSRFRQR